MHVLPGISEEEILAIKANVKAAQELEAATPKAATELSERELAESRNLLEKLSKIPCMAGSSERSLH